MVQRCKPKWQVTMAQVKHVSYYTNVMQSWSKGELGKAPSEAQLALAHVFGRPGKQSMATAMALREGGVTGQQIKLASALFDGKATPQLNHMRDLIAAKQFERLPVPGAYALKIAPKGQQFVDLHGAKAAAVQAPKAEPSAKSKRKVTRKAAVKAATEAAPAETPTSDVAPVNESPTAELTQ